jgi:hypothetical protein
MHVLHPIIKLAVTIVLLCSCNNTGNNMNNSTTGKDTSDNVQPTAQPTATPGDTVAENENYTSYYVTACSVGDNYTLLDREMYALAQKTGLPIDTMEKHYDAKKKMIVYAEDGDDEMYRGEYFPRRFEGLSLSIEQMSAFQKKAPVHSMALIAAICNTRQQADSVLKVVRPYAPKVYVFYTKLYTGCMH